MIWFASELPLFGTITSQWMRQKSFEQATKFNLLRTCRFFSPDGNVLAVYSLAWTHSILGISFVLGSVNNWLEWGTNESDILAFIGDDGNLLALGTENGEIGMYGMHTSSGQYMYRDDWWSLLSPINSSVSFISSDSKTCFLLEPTVGPSARVESESIPRFRAMVTREHIMKNH